MLAGRPTSFSWKEFLQSEPAKPGDRRRLIAIWPKLDFSSLEPGRQATAAIREAGERANLESDFHARLRLTGPVPIVDQEFATLQQGALLNGVVTTALVLLILWLALRSFKIVLAVSLTLGAGLAITAAVGLLVVGAFNPISLAFAVLCVGLGADFAIQFSVRYRAERQACGELRKARGADQPERGTSPDIGRGVRRSWFHVVPADRLHRHGRARPYRRLWAWQSPI